MRSTVRFGLGLAAALLAQVGAKAQSQVWSANAGVVSDYRFRGISQTRLQPAVQGGVDYSGASGAYFGAWASNIRWVQDAGAQDGSVELDLYGGYRWRHTEVDYDLALLRYDYVGNDLGRTGRPPGRRPRSSTRTRSAVGGVTWTARAVATSRSATSGLWPQAGRWCRTWATSTCATPRHRPPTPTTR